MKHRGPDPSAPSAESPRRFMSSNSNKLSRMTLTEPSICRRQGFSDVSMPPKKPYCGPSIRILAPKTRLVWPLPGFFSETVYQDSRTNQSFKSPPAIFTRDERAAFMGEQVMSSFSMTEGRIGEDFRSGGGVRHGNDEGASFAGDAADLHATAQAPDALPDAQEPGPEGMTGLGRIELSIHAFRAYPVALPRMGR